MKCETKKIQPTPPPVEYVLTLSEEEAALVALLSFRHEVISGVSLYSQMPQEVCDAALALNIKHPKRTCNSARAR